MSTPEQLAAKYFPESQERFLRAVALAKEAQAELEAALQARTEALKELVAANEQWNASVAAVIGRPPNWTDGYLDKARAALAGGTAP